MMLGRLLIAALLLGATLNGQTSVLPATVTPFPAGLTGTLVFHSDLRAPDNPDGRNHLFTIDLATRKVTQLTSGGNHHDQHPKWSPDGKRISFVSSRSGSFDLYVMNADGTNVTRVTDHQANDYDPIWMPDGQSLIFSSERDSRSDLYRVWLADKRVDRLTHHFVGRAIMPSISPDGKSVAFAAQTLAAAEFLGFPDPHSRSRHRQEPRARCAGGDLLAVVVAGWQADRERRAARRSRRGCRSATPTGEQSRELRPDPKRWHYYPDWSNDGRLIAFSVSPAHHEGEDWDLAIAAPDGSRYQRLTTGPGNDRLPDWKP